MTKETILKRLLLEDHITLDELIILAKNSGETFYIDLSVLPEEDQSYFLNKHWSSSFNTTPYHTSPNIVSSKL